MQTKETYNIVLNCNHTKIVTNILQLKRKWNEKNKTVKSASENCRTDVFVKLLQKAENKADISIYYFSFQ